MPIYELRTYNLRPGAVGEFERRYAQRVEARTRHSPLWGFWHTEIGELNQIVHVWLYDSLSHRAAARDAAKEDPVLQGLPWCWDLMAAQDSLILFPAPFMRTVPPSDYGSGNVYELRMYTYQPGTIGQVLERWQEVLPDRERYSPLVGCWHSELGPLNRLVHLWVYRDLAERARIRAAAKKEPRWPPKTAEWLLRQENKILVPAPFSPLQ